MQNSVSFSSSSFFSTSGSDKYGGLIVQPLHKRAMNAIEKYIAFFDYHQLDWPIFHWVISILRMLQFLGPSIVAGDELIWGINNAPAKFVSIFSISYNYYPAELKMDDVSSPILLAFSAIVVIYLLTFLIAAVQYAKNGKTPYSLAYFLNIFCNSVGFLMQPFCEHLLCSIVARTATGKMQFTALRVAACVANQACTIISFWFISSLFLRTLNFHPCSLLSLEEYAQMMVMLYSLLLSGVAAVVTELGKAAKIGGLSICAVLYFASIAVIYLKGTFVQVKHQILFAACSLWGGLNCLTLAIFCAIGRRAAEAGLALIVCWGLISFFVAHFLVRGKIRRHIALLDDFEEEHDASIFRSPSHLVNAALSGFQFGHPSCLDFSIFRSGCALWQESGELWFVFAKFNVIYPENTSVLSMISQSVQTSRIRSNLAKFAVRQIVGVQKTRESNLTSELKTKIGRIQKLMNATKRKMRNIWDLILQGNTKDLESNVRSVFSAVQNLTKELDQLMMQFPNNRFVARLYARYENEIMADSAGFQKWHENVSLLQRGVNVIPDIYHEMGVAQFENIPNRIVNEYAPSKAMLETDMSLDDFAEDDMKGTQKLTIPDLVANHRVAAIRRLYYLMVFATLFIIILPTVVVLSTYPSTHDAIAAPLDYLYGVAYLRQLNYMLASISGRLFMISYRKSDDDEPLSDNKTIGNIDFTAFGGSSDYRRMLSFFVKEVGSSADKLDSFRHSDLSSPAVRRAKSILFEDTVPYYFYYSLNDFYSINQSAETIVNNVANQFAKVLSDKVVIDEDLIHTSDILIGWNNYMEPGIMISSALESTIEYMNDNSESYNRLYFYLEIGLIIFMCVSLTIIILYGLSSLSKDKQSIFKVFTYLPKTVISNVSASFYNLKNAKDRMNSTATTEGADTSKPEEAILKIFTSIADSSFDLNDSAMIIILVAILVIFGCLGAHFACQMVQVLTTTLRSMAPHINYLLGVSSYMHGLFASLFKAVMKYNGIDATTSIHNNLKNVTVMVNKMWDYYHQSRYGGDEKTDSPYVGMMDGLNIANSRMPCQETDYITNDFYNITSCFGADQCLYIFLVNVKRIIALYRDEGLSARGRLTDLWNLGPMISYENLFQPLASEIVDTITKYTVSEFYRLLQNSVIFLVLCVVTLILILVEIHLMEKPLIFALAQLQHCPEDVCLKIPKMMALLSGDYSTGSDDSAEKDDKFFDNVVNKLTGLIVVVNMGDHTVQSTNKAFDQFFGFAHGEFLKKNIWTDFFESGKFEGSFSTFKTEQKARVIYSKDGQKLNILWTLTNLESDIIIEGRDISTQVRHETLISDEKKRSDAMLASILPPSLVPRVQAGESNISFAVKSVTVSFIDIVSFTPWCGSNTAQYVMRMLNLIFKEFDSVVSQLPTLTRIKCIGDCYMCAGGIFDEVNQPAEHARAMVEFGCQAIKKIQMIDETENESLRIRVGVNTGGPIVAGILGSDKPTFEILGPAINIAQQMEHNGVPMQVHLSRAVYELIYGDKFTIKERGEIDVKNTKMFTYLVSPDDNEEDVKN